MTINEGAFIKISYSTSGGIHIFDTTDEAAAKDAGIHTQNKIYGPVTICVGHKHVVLGLDEELVGKDTGFEADITVPPEKAFGEREPKLVKSFPKNKFKEKPVRGMTVNFGEDGEGTVINVIGSKVIVDFNSPLAGETLTCHYKIEEIVDNPLDQLKGLIRIYAGKEMEIALDAGKATVTLPPGTNHDRRWLLWRGRILHEGFKLIPGINEITLVETFKRPEKTE